MKLRNNAKSAFTLVEIMIVVAIIGLLVAIAIPNFFRYRESSRRGVCIANLRQVQNAKTQWACEKGKQSTAVPPEDEIVGPANYLRIKPYCPGGGDDYIVTIGTVGEQATCSRGLTEGHTL
ncbi:MAG: type pilus assembly protein PilA [Verrucomicrobiota bacterium]|jgi:prepilin-type N-terminal cleavage/methylation domain-containing protein